MFCRKCGKEIVDGSVYCSFCGAEQAPEEEQAEVYQAEKTEPPSADSAEEPSSGPGQKRSLLHTFIIAFNILVVIACLSIILVVLAQWISPRGKSDASSSAPALPSSRAPSVSSQKKEPVELKQGDIGYNVFHSLIGDCCTDFSVYEVPDNENPASPMLQVAVTVKKESIDDFMSHCFSAFSFYREEEWPYIDITVGMDGMGMLFLTLGEPSSWTSFFINDAEDEAIKATLDSAYQEHFYNTDLLTKSGL